MAEVENVVVVRFTEPSNAYQALSVLKQCDADGRIALGSAAVVERTPTGELRIAEGADNIGLVGTASGSLIGMLVGVLGGPVGVLVGWGAGALMGGAFDIDRAEKSDEALAALGRAMPPESTAVIATAAEPAVEVIDGEMTKLGGEVTRRPVAEVMDELEASEEAAEAAAREARRALREERKAEVTADLDERVRKAEGEAPHLLTTASARRRLSPATGSARAARHQGGSRSCTPLRMKSRRPRRSPLRGAGRRVAPSSRSRCRSGRSFWSPASLPSRGRWRRSRASFSSSSSPSSASPSSRRW